MFSFGPYDRGGWVGGYLGAYCIGGGGGGCMGYLPALLGALETPGLTLGLPNIRRFFYLFSQKNIDI